MVYKWSRLDFWGGEFRLRMIHLKIGSQVWSPGEQRLFVGSLYCPETWDPGCSAPCWAYLWLYLSCIWSRWKWSYFTQDTTQSKLSMQIIQIRVSWTQRAIDVILDHQIKFKFLTCCWLPQNDLTIAELCHFVKNNNEATKFSVFHHNQQQQSNRSDL